MTNVATASSPFQEGEEYFKQAVRVVISKDIPISYETFSEEELEDWKTLFAKTSQLKAERKAEWKKIIQKSFTAFNEYILANKDNPHGWYQGGIVLCFAGDITRARLHHDYLQLLQSTQFAKNIEALIDLRLNQHFLAHPHLTKLKEEFLEVKNGIDSEKLSWFLGGMVMTFGTDIFLEGIAQTGRFLLGSEWGLLFYTCFQCRYLIPYYSSVEPTLVIIFSKLLFKSSIRYFNVCLLQNNGFEKR